jgi:hypothetical protein
MAAARKIVL